MTILFASTRPVNRARNFGLGIVAPASKPATDAEYAAHRLASTISPAEWAAIKFDRACEAISDRLDAMYAARN